MELAVTCSIGVAWLRPGDTGEQLLARADLALYRAKDAGRNRVELAIEPEPETV
jgi:Response regulator containing a CheY-like receiver domain and a GGDEF domain